MANTCTEKTCCGPDPWYTCECVCCTRGHCTNETLIEKN